MKAIISCTDDDLYLFNLPFAAHSWRKIGVEPIIMWTDCIHDQEIIKRRVLALETCGRPMFSCYIDAQLDKQPTYAQCARLYAAAIPTISGSEILITTDADMCVFDKAYWEQFEYNGAINIIGSDLVPDGQVPMCYIAMPAVGWRNVMEMNHRSYQECLDDLLGHIETENFRGNYWAKDQEEAYKRIITSPFPIVRHLRASPGTQFASRRADRDGWVVTPDIIDAHLPRPGYTEENFKKIIQLFETMYDDDLGWMYDYRDEYVKLMV